MASSRDNEHFALDWIKSDLLETLNQARVALDEYAEQGEDETRLRACLTNLHQLHGTLLMLELEGITLLADHLEQAAQKLMLGEVAEPAAVSQLLMQGILEMPGYLDELQRGAEDKVGLFIPLVNDIRALLELEAIVDHAGQSLKAGASDESVKRFLQLDGQAKVARMRSAYQSVLLSILKGDDRSAAIETLRKIAVGLQRLTAGSSMERQWQAFGEFVNSLADKQGALESDAVKLLRRVDIEIKSLAADGENALKKPANLELVESLLDATDAQQYESETVSGLREAVERDSSHNTLAISGRQALATAAVALRDELAVIKDKLDLLARAGSLDLDALQQLTIPLSQIGSTLSVLGFESSREIIADQVKSVKEIVVLGDADPAGIQGVASALAQVDENLHSVSNERSEIEQITSDAQLQLLREARKGLETVKSAVVDYVTAHWDVRHLENIPLVLKETCGALDIIPLPRVTELLQLTSTYVENTLLEGIQPAWHELDQFADAISGIDYFLERLAEESTQGIEDILPVAERSLSELLAAKQVAADTAAVESLDQTREEIPEEIPEEIKAEFKEEPTEEPGEEIQEDFQIELLEETDETEESDELVAAIDLEQTSTEVNADQPDAEIELEAAAASDALPPSAPDTDEPEGEDIFDPATLTFDQPGEAEAVSFDQEADESFDLSNEMFADLDGVVEEPAESGAQESGDFIASLDLAGDGPQKTNLPVQEATPEQDVAEAAQEQEIEFAGEPPDEEIVEIFLEEVGEVLETIDEWLPQWAQNLDANSEAMTEVRRAFHTLKGSGRIVQAVEIGELAWGIENMLNRVIDGTVEPNMQFEQLIKRARDLVPALADAFERRRMGDRNAIAEIVEAADILASGGSIETTGETSAAPASNDFDNLEFIGKEEQTIGGGAESTIEFDVSEVGPDSEQPQTESEHAYVADSADEVESEEEAEQLFKDEIAEGIAVLRQEQLQQPWSLSESLRRTLHTMAGTAATARADAIAFVIAPANQVVDVFAGGPVAEGLREFFDDVVMHLEAALQALDDPTWEEPVELVARADDLIALGLTKPDLQAELLQSEATAKLFAAEDALEDILTGNVPATDLLSALTDCVGLATRADQTTTSDLAAALMRTVTTATISGGVGNSARVTIQQGYSALLDQLNVLVGGGNPPSRADMIHLLDHIDFTATDAEAVIEPRPGERPSVDVQHDAEEESVELDSITEDDLALTPVDDANSTGTPNLADLDIDADLVEVFFEEAEEISEELETSILDWSAERDNRLYLENILRGLHTLKGGARLCGLMHIGDTAHDFETMVILVQNGERQPDDELFKDLHSRFDGMVEQLSVVKAELFRADTAGDVTTTEQASVAPALVEDSTPGEGIPTADSTEAKTEDKVLELVDDDSTPVAAEAPQEDAPVEQAAAAPTVVRPAEEATEALVAMRQAGTDLKKPEASPEKQERTPQEMVRVGAGLLEELVNLAGENSILRARIEQGMSDFTGALDEMETTIERLREQLRRLEIETETQVLFRSEREDGPLYENFDPLEMDRYSQLQQLSRGLSESASDMLDLKDTLLFKARESETLLLQQARINTELQEGLMRTRMVPFNRLMPRLRRIVRQVAGELDKEVEFHVQNAEGELDRNLLERMVPPLEHMLRNAVDHGIEMPAERRNFGKSASGRIDLKLSREGGDVVIEISDDGAGIDVESVRAKAIEKGLCDSNSILSDDDVMQFVLAPGFSTAKSVTQISGRGVGMDVVHSEVKQLGGSISISSAVGRGTRFVVRVPFTVSVNRALMVSVAEDLYAIPLNNIEGIVLLNPEELDKLHSSEQATFEYAGVPYRPRYLGQYLGREYHGPQVGQTSVPVVLVRSGDHAVAIHVDAVQGSREIVVKSLGPQFAGVGGISGATILGDGSVVVILDLHALIRAQRQFGKQQTTELAGLGRPRCVMVVDDSVTVRKVTSRLLERQGMDVLVAKDGVEAVALLQERRPDVMLLDIEMPRMDGFEVARQVRHDERLDNLPIVMISSRTGEKHKEHAISLGVNKFLGKPFQENELLATIDELVTRT